MLYYNSLFLSFSFFLSFSLSIFRHHYSIISYYMSLWLAQSIHQRNIYDTISLIQTKVIELQSKIAVDNNNYRFKLSLLQLTIKYIKTVQR